VQEIPIFGQVKIGFSEQPAAMVAIGERSVATIFHQGATADHPTNHHTFK
jgi:hypothetical protein